MRFSSWLMTKYGRLKKLMWDMHTSDTESRDTLSNSFRFPLVATHKNVQAFCDDKYGLGYTNIFKYLIDSTKHFSCSFYGTTLTNYINNNFQYRVGHDQRTGACYYMSAEGKFCAELDTESFGYCLHVNYNTETSRRRLSFDDRTALTSSTDKLLALITARAFTLGILDKVVVPEGVRPSPQYRRMLWRKNEPDIEFAEETVNQVLFIYRPEVDKPSHLWYNGITDEMEEFATMFQKHKTKDGKEMLIMQMNDGHLYNTIKMICREVKECAAVLEADFQPDNAVFAALIPEANSEDIKRKARNDIQIYYSRLTHYVFEASRRNIDISRPLQEAFGKEKLQGRLTSTANPYLLEGDDEDV